MFKRFQLDPRIKSELESQRVLITIGLVCSSLAALLTVGTAELTKRILEVIELLAREKNPADTSKLWSVCFGIVLLFGARYFLVRGQTFYLAEAVARLTGNLRLKIMRKLVRLPVTYFNEKKSGAIQSVLGNDVNVFQSAVQILKDSIEAPAKAIGMLIYLIVLQWQMALMTFLLIPVLGIIVHQNQKRMRRAQDEVQAALASITSTSQETLQGIRVVKAFGAETQVDAEYLRLNEEGIATQLKTATLLAKLRPLVEFLGALGLVISFGIGGWLALHGDMNVPKLATMAFALDAINQGFKGISGLSSTYASVQAAADRIYSEVLDVPEPPENSGSKVLDQVTGHIEFRDVSFVYPDGTPALKNVSFAIEPGQSLALVGPSGAGKSTIADLLLRFYEPTSGMILLDGVDIKEIDSKWMRTQIGVVPQQTFLFAGSIDDNLRLGSPEATGSDIVQALENAHALDFTNEFRERNVPVLGERGVKLSGGQMQRIAIARALVRDPKILLLDEATSALDAASESAVTEALQEVMTRRTTLFIAHRLTTAARADMIVFLNKGEIVEVGTHKELIAKDSAYAAQFRLFTSGVLGDSF
jgi:subfamily B ATP-binding cassette protein MsbA